MDYTKVYRIWSDISFGRDPRSFSEDELIFIESTRGISYNELCEISKQEKQIENIVKFIDDENIPHDNDSLYTAISTLAIYLLATLS